MNLNIDKARTIIAEFKAAPTRDDEAIEQLVIVVDVALAEVARLRAALAKIVFAYSASAHAHQLAEAAPSGEGAGDV